MLFHNPLQSGAKSMVILDFVVSRSEQSSGGKLADSTQDDVEGPVSAEGSTHSKSRSARESKKDERPPGEEEKKKKLRPGRLQKITWPG